MSRAARSALSVLVLAGGFTAPSLAKPTPPPTPVPTSAPGAKPAAAPPPTPEPLRLEVVSPTPVPTPAPPTDTPIPTATDTPPPTSTPTDTPTPTPTPTATGTPAPTPTPTPPPTTTAGEVATVSAVVLGLAVLSVIGVLGPLSVARAVRSLEHTYRRQKSLELEQMQAQAVERRLAEVKGLLVEEEGWRVVLDQVLADALPEAKTRTGPEGILDLSFAPVPRFTVAGVEGRTYLFTTAPEVLRRVGVLKRREQVVVLDAALSPAVRVEVQAVWDHLAAERLGAHTPVLPRQAEWFLVAREGG